MQQIIAGYWEKSKDEIAVIVLVVLSGALGFGMGRLSKFHEMMPPVSVEAAEIGADALSAAVVIPSPSSVKTASPTGSFGKGILVASKSGKKYHLTWCPGARTISEQNKIYFNTKEEAEAAGYLPASNCKDLRTLK